MHRQLNVRHVEGTGLLRCPGGGRRRCFCFGGGAHRPGESPGVTDKAVPCHCSSRSTPVSRPRTRSRPLYPVQSRTFCIVRGRPRSGTAFWPRVRDARPGDVSAAEPSSDTRRRQLTGVRRVFFSSCFFFFVLVSGAEHVVGGGQRDLLHRHDHAAVPQCLKR